ncbi:MAG: hypothetical protein KF791_20515 [Verrucomicrobiae bacterium]|nr:hypothetical protein [Verrucomicrobiae bacterium]
MEQVHTRLVEELERPRPLTDQVLRHLAAAHGVDRSGAGVFLGAHLASFEDDEYDLMLSSLYTPKLEDQAIFAGLLGANAVPQATVTSWVRELEARPTLGRLLPPDEAILEFPHRAVTLERYLFRLRLEATVPGPLERLIQTLPPAADRPVLVAMARRAIWNTEPRREVLLRFLSAHYADAGADLKDPVALLGLMESSEPADIRDILSRIPAWEQVVRAQVTAAGAPSPFFNERVQDLHGGGRDQRSGSMRLQALKQEELGFLGRLGQRLRG